MRKTCLVSTQVTTLDICESRRHGTVQMELLMFSKCKRSRKSKRV